MRAKALLLITALFLTTMAVWGQGSFTQGAIKGYKIKMNVGQPVGSVYHWTVNPSSGTSTDLTEFTGDTITIVWDGSVGDYTLSVQVNDGNGCLSETISKNVEILSPGVLVFDTDYPNAIVCSDLMEGEGSSLPHSESIFQVVYDGDANLASATFTIKNPDEMFVGIDGKVLANQDNPEITIDNETEDKTLNFAISDTWENTSGEDLQFTITLVAAITTDKAKIIANPETDIVRNITVLPKPVIGF